MKIKEKEEARVLRKEEGLSIGDIAKKVGVSKGTVSIWVRDIELTEKQNEVLRQKNPIYNCQTKGFKTTREKFKVNRILYQECGKKIAQKNDAEFISGCMLYWAEGTKSKNSVIFSNSDPEMILYFMNFLIKYFLVGKEDILLTINCFTDIKSFDEIKYFWLNKLNLEENNLRKSTINCYSKYSQKKRKNKLSYGTARITVHSTEIVHKIFGAIQFIGKFKREEWIF